MSRVNSFIEQLYALSKQKGYDGEKVDNIIYNAVESCAHSNNWFLINNVFYNIDINKVYIEVAHFLINRTEDYKDNLPMRKYFIKQCHNTFKNHSEYYDLIYHFYINI